MVFKRADRERANAFYFTNGFLGRNIRNPDHPEPLGIGPTEHDADTDIRMVYHGTEYQG